MTIHSTRSRTRHLPRGKKTDSPITGIAVTADNVTKDERGERDVQRHQTQAADGRKLNPPRLSPSHFLPPPPPPETVTTPGRSTVVAAPASSNGYADIADISAFWEQQCSGQSKRKVTSLPMNSAKTPYGVRGRRASDEGGTYHSKRHSYTPGAAASRQSPRTAELEELRRTLHESTEYTKELERKLQRATERIRYLEEQGSSKSDRDDLGEECARQPFQFEGSPGHDGGCDTFASNVDESSGADTRTHLERSRELAKALTAYVRSTSDGGDSEGNDSVAVEVNDAMQRVSDLLHGTDDNSRGDMLSNYESSADAKKNGWSEGESTPLHAEDETLASVQEWDDPFSYCSIQEERSDQWPTPARMRQLGEYLREQMIITGAELVPASNEIALPSLAQEGTETCSIPTWMTENRPLLDDICLIVSTVEEDALNSDGSKETESITTRAEGALSTLTSADSGDSAEEDLTRIIRACHGACTSLIAERESLLSETIELLDSYREERDATWEVEMATLHRRFVANVSHSRQLSTGAASHPGWRRTSF